ncbi:hypothetical protein MK805_05255 [Shimazuella sp. AN120528]|uniref:hypothetical protein n=1 Tax=Shimazuella soli TaxID=1892854 RepID=UPI001F0E0E48|nr:hypothetical protein [Shimazuella soli]MCH5584377.1 hypothetical protein [Shimazuella soli]
MTPELRKNIVALVNLLPEAEKLVTDRENPLEFISKAEPVIVAVKEALKEIEDEELREYLSEVAKFFYKAQKKISTGMKGLFDLALSPHQTGLVKPDIIQKGCLDDIQAGFNSFKNGMKALREAKKRAGELFLSVESQ